MKRLTTLAILGGFLALSLSNSQAQANTCSNNWQANNNRWQQRMQKRAEKLQQRQLAFQQQIQNSNFLSPSQLQYLNPATTYQQNPYFPYQQTSYNPGVWQTIRNWF